MAYVEWHDTVRNHPKTDALMLALKIKRREAVGIIGCLSSWAIQYRPGGRIQAKHVGVAVEWEGKNADLVSALVDVGWIDKIDDEWVEIHDWKDITRGYKKAQKDAKRKRREYRESLHGESEEEKRDAPRSDLNGSDLKGTEQKGTKGAEIEPPSGSLDFLLRLAHSKHLAGRPETITQYVTAWYHRVGAEETEKMLTGSDGMSVNDIQDKFFPRNGKPHPGTVESALDDWVKKKTGGVPK